MPSALTRRRTTTCYTRKSIDFAIYYSIIALSSSHPTVSTSWEDQSGLFEMVSRFMVFIGGNGHGLVWQSSFSRTLVNMPVSSSYNKRILYHLICWVKYFLTFHPNNTFRYVMSLKFSVTPGAIATTTKLPRRPLMVIAIHHKRVLVQDQVNFIMTAIKQIPYQYYSMEAGVGQTRNCTDHCLFTM